MIIGYNIIRKGIIIYGEKSKLLQELEENIAKISNEISDESIPITFMEELTEDITYGLIDYRADITY